MAEYRKGYRIDPETGLTKPEQNAGLTRAEAEAQVDDERPAPRPSPAVAAASSRRGRTWGIVGASVGGLFLLLIILGIALGGGDGGSDSSSPGSATTQAEAPPPPPPPSTKAANGDDITDIHNRAQDAVTRAHACLISVALAVSDTKDAATMAGNLQDARSICENARDELATMNTHGFTDQSTTLFASADEGRASTGAGLAYLDTQYPTKLADFRRHVENTQSYFKQGLRDLNARLDELGVPRVKG